MSDALVFYTNPMSRGRIVRWMLEEVGVPYSTEIRQYTELKSPDYLAINPMGKVPAIRHGDVVVTECGAICAYLADAFPAAKLAPASGSAARGPYYRWLFYAAGPIEAAVTNKALGVEVPPDKQGMAGYGTVETVIRVLEQALAHDGYVAGPEFSAADVYVGSQLAFAMLFGSIEKRPVFSAYLERVQARPAALRAREIDDALLPEERRGQM